MSEIININEDWQLHSGAEVQAYVKKLLGDLDRGLADKIGCLRTYEPGRLRIPRRLQYLV